MLKAILLKFLPIFFWINVKSCSGFVYTQHSGYGCFVAIAVPLNIPHHNAFVSYNFATTYGIPYDIKSLKPGLKGTFGEIQETNDNTARTGLKLTEIASNSTKDNSKNVKKVNQSNTLLSKRAVYSMLRDKLKMFGFEPNTCLLKLICEVNAAFFGSSNGVLGSILHILITPSASAFENLPRRIYKAEEDGLKGECYKYQITCPKNLLDIISAPVENFLLNEYFNVVHKL